MKRPAVLIVGAAAGALLVAAVGASAHTGLSLTSLVGVHSAIQGDETTGTETASPEPSESPEASETPEATTEPAEAADNDNEQGDNDEQGENEDSAPTQSNGSGEHEQAGTTAGKND